MQRGFTFNCTQKIKEFRWDGHWYLRAYFDNGESLGSVADRGVPDRLHHLRARRFYLGPERCQRVKSAMAKVDSLLVNRDASLIQPLGPPFDKPDLLILAISKVTSRE